MSATCNAQPTIIEGDPASRLLLIVDHASAIVPPDIDLGIAPDLLAKHIAIDIGVEPLARAIAARLNCPAIVASVTRLVVDLHRERGNARVIPEESDGHVIHGNRGLTPADREVRLARFWDPYHRRIAAMIDEATPAMLFTLHSFTPQLETDAAARPWQIGLLYNEDDRAARLAIAKLQALGLSVGDNQPYSGKLLNATMNRHAEARGLPYLAIEVRNDLIAEAEGARKWVGILAPVIAEVRDELLRETV